MSLNDPIADMLTRIRNASRNQAKQVRCLNNKVCRGVASTLREEGYIDDFEVVDDGKQGQIRINLRYGPRGETLIHSIQRASKVGCRLYKKVDELPKPKQGLGICIVSTSKGVMSDRRCRAERVGGELLATVD